MRDADHLFQRLCLEAARACGDDMTAIERYVFDRIETMDPVDRERIKRDLERVLAFRAPTRPVQSH